MKLLSQRGALTLLLALVFCFTGSPAWALFFCPVLHHDADTHACCPMHHRAPAPTPLCAAHCSTAPSVAVRHQVVSIDLNVPAITAATSPLAPAVRPTSTAAPVDSSGLWLRDRVLRI